MKLEEAGNGEVLVAVMNSLSDWETVTQHGWYRIPVDSAPKRFPPKWLAFYHTKVFGEKAFAVHFVAKVDEVKQVRRDSLFPNEPLGPKSSRLYHRVSLRSLQPLVRPIPSLRLRRIVFISTTTAKFKAAKEINDLFDESPLEDVLWEEFKRLSLPAERQFYVSESRKWFALDFALFCRDGKIDIEADGDRWHSQTERIPEDNARNNALASLGWQVLRFNGSQIRERLESDCIPEIIKTVNRLGGLDDSKGPPRSHIPTSSGIFQQMGLFEEEAPYPSRFE